MYAREHHRRCPGLSHVVTRVTPLTCVLVSHMCSFLRLSLSLLLSLFLSLRTSTPQPPPLCFSASPPTHLCPSDVGKNVGLSVTVSKMTSRRKDQSIRTYWQNSSSFTITRHPTKPSPKTLPRSLPYPCFSLPPSFPLSPICVPALVIWRCEGDCLRGCVCVCVCVFVFTLRAFIRHRAQGWIDLHVCTYAI